MKRTLFILVSLAIFLSCKTTERSTSSTDLTEEGNAEVIARFKKFENQDKHCKAGGNGKRVMITGFGLFQSASYNISGAVVDAMSNKDFWPDNVSNIKNSQLKTDFNKVLDPGSSAKGENGVHLVNRSLMVEGQAYEVCFMVLDVFWDLAAAIILTESNNFDPEMIIMSGRGGGAAAVLEGGAINNASAYGGFGSDGVQSLINIPKVAQSYVLPKENFSIETLDKFNSEVALVQIPMTWDNKTLAASMQEAAPAFQIMYQVSARPSNNYICNNVSLVLLQASKGREVSLAGDKLILSTKARPKAIGFFHYPVNAPLESKSMYSWSKALATAVHVQLSQ